MNDVARSAPLARDAKALHAQVDGCRGVVARHVLKGRPAEEEFRVDLKGGGVRSVGSIMLRGSSTDWDSRVLAARAAAQMEA